MKAIFLIFALFLFGCGGDKTDNPPPFNNQNNENNKADMSDMDESDADVGTQGDMGPIEDMMADVPATCPEIPCEAGFRCQNSVCILADSCIVATDLGELTAGATIMGGGNLAEGVDAHTAECGNTGMETVFQFTTTETLNVTYSANWMGQFDGLLDIRTDCADETSAILCVDNESGNITIPPGTYFLFLEVRLGNPGEFAFQLSGEAAACIPGTQTCNGDMLEICLAGSVLESFECGGSCTAGECDGKTCQGPITVVAPGGLYEGDSRGYQGALDFELNASCGALATPGYEVIFNLPGLTAGDIVSIGTVGESAQNPDININAIFITALCGDDQTCVASFIGYEGGQNFGDTVDWVVGADGDYTIVIDNLIAGGSPFRYKVEIIDL